jgi:hypothetical protein
MEKTNFYHQNFLSAIVALVRGNFPKSVWDQAKSEITANKKTLDDLWVGPAITQPLSVLPPHLFGCHANLKPTLKIALQGSQPTITWNKQNMDSLELWVDRSDGKGSVFLAIDTIPDYTDTAALPASGASAVWKYRGVYREDDTQVGQWSDVIATTVMG